MSACGRRGQCREGHHGQCLGGGILGYKIDGIQADYVRVPFADTSTYFIPAGLTDEAVLMVADILPTAYELGVINGGIRPGDTVAIVGAGPIGLSAASIGSAMNDTARLVGGAFGVAVLGTILSQVYRTHIAGAATQLTSASGGATRDSLQAALQVAGHLGGVQGDALRAAARLAFSDAMARAALVGALVAFAATLVALVLLPARPGPPEAPSVDSDQPADRPTEFSLDQRHRDLGSFLE